MATRVSPNRTSLTNGCNIFKYGDGFLNEHQVHPGNVRSEFIADPELESSQTLRRLPEAWPKMVCALTIPSLITCSSTLVLVLRVCESVRFPVVWRGPAAGAGVTLADIMNKKKKGLGWFSHSSDTHGKSTHTSPQAVRLCDMLVVCVCVCVRRECVWDNASVCV